MGLKTFIFNTKDIPKETTLRCDVDFIDFQRSFAIDDYYSFNDLFEIVKDNKVNINNLDDFYYSEISNVDKNGVAEPVELNFNIRQIEDENYYKKIEKGDIIRVQKGDILIAKARPNLKKYVFIDEYNENYFYSSAFIHLRPKKMNKILYYCFRNIFYNNLIALSREGKGYPTLKEDDIVYLKFDKKIIDKLYKDQEQLNVQLQSLEEKIKKLKKQIKNPHEIINKVFAREFSFDEDLYNELGKGMTAGTKNAKNKTLRVFKTNLKEIPKSNNLRLSTRFHNPPTKKLMNLLSKIKTLKVKDILKEPVRRGTSPQYNPEGDIPVVKTNHLKNDYIEISQEEFVDKEFYKSTPKSQIKKGDILIASTGKASMGKIDLWEYEQEAIADSHISIVRIDNKKYNPLFFVYFFRSVLGYFQIERDYTGTTNQIELSSTNEIPNFQIPDVSLELQQKIVDEINEMLNTQKEIEKKIERQRNKINEIINLYK